MSTPKLLRSPDGNLVEFDCEFVYATDSAILVTDGENKYWIPKSKIEETEEGEGKNMTIYIPEWLAIEKEIV